MPLTVSAISKRFSNNWALKDVSFQVEDGEIFGICGLAGSGKSVLAKIIAGRLNPDGGSVGAGSQTAAVDPIFFASDGIGQTGFLNRLFGRDRRPRPGVEIIGTALASRAKLIILDEVFGGLGPDECRRQFRLLRTAIADGKKIGILASSRFDQLADVCDRIAVLDRGEMVQTGTAEQLYCEPESAAAAQATGRVNLIEARRLSSSKQDNPEFQTIVGSHRIFAEKKPGRPLGPLNRNVQLGIRPEHISIAFGASFPEDNSIKAVLENVRFCGAETFVDCNADGLALSVAVRRLVGLEVGSECLLGLPQERIMLL